MGVDVEKVVTSGTFSLDGGTWEVDNNVWLVGDDHEVIVIDAAHDAAAITAAVGDRRVVAILLTHAHDDHVDAAPALAEATGAPVYLNPADEPLWDLAHPGRPLPEPLTDGQAFEVAGTTLIARHTPGHAPGAMVFVAPDLGAVFTGDTLFQGGPGATGRSYSDFPTIVESITDVLLTLPPETVVHTGHGDDTTIGAEAPHRQEWLDRGH
ncbi:MBL fold metallo-hydrolase [Branchiibius sp. NY16-3462-2]|uniref:MBL fold metallo-hydrolase n=1 Tax=Branchiibius sp. NY16-3462-2 TaxID=1807500 RepID=UPI0007926654|nr:MBL fold metallo-hydrolase [Branchiibius sp. NY16-3462-2]KYH44557.1 hypothetical protein AZH51_08635 [Branchiibius sp. NY16-3462-2]